VARREGAAGEGRGEEHRHQKLDADHGGAQARGALGLARARQRPGEASARRARQQEQAAEGQRQHRGPAQQAQPRVHEQRDQPRRAFEVVQALHSARVHPWRVDRVGRQPAVQGLVDGDPEGHREEGELRAADGEQAAPHPPQVAGGNESDQRGRREVLHPQPRHEAEQGEQHERLAARDPIVLTQGEQGRAGQADAGRELGQHRGGVHQQRRRETHGGGRAEGPGVGHDAQRQAVAQADRQGGDGGEQQRRTRRPCYREGRSYQQRHPDPRGLEQLTLALLADRPHRCGLVVAVGALAQVVEDVEVAVLDQRLRREQDVRLVAREARRALGLEAGRQGVGEKEPGEEEGAAAQGAAHARPGPDAAVHVWKTLSALTNFSKGCRAHHRGPSAREPAPPQPKKAISARLNASECSMLQR